jgi:hypothetical protein
MAKMKKILGSISPFAGAVTGEGLFGKGLGAMNRALGPMAGIAPRMAGAAQKKNARRAVVEAEMGRRSGMLRGRPMMAEDAMMVEEAPAGVMMAKGGKAKAKKMAKGGSTASKRGDGCATKGKTKGRFV